MFQVLSLTTFSQVWQYFITRSEQEQRDYLDSVAPKTHHKSNDRGLGGFAFTQINNDTLEEDLPGAEGMCYHCVFT